MSIDPNDLLFGEGAPSAKFPTIGASVRGVIDRIDTSQQRDLDGKPKTYEDGNPAMQVVITLQTDERDPEIANDEGRRNLYAKGQMRGAIRDAILAAGQQRIEVGATLAVRYEADEPSTKRGYNAKKIYRAQYQAPAPVTDSLSADSLI